MLASTARASRPKLSLAVPATSNVATATTTSTARRPSLSLAVPAAMRSPLPPARSPLPPPRAPAMKNSKKNKKVQFREEADIKCVTPLPEECYGGFVKMGREERRWALAAASRE